jgi:hypothetical protein
MFNYTQFTNDLIKAMTHKYIRRVPKGVTKTGKTKYMYYYAGQEGHGKGIAHDEELVHGASFALGSSSNRYHAHITNVTGDNVTVKYDDGTKKGQQETMTKKQFRSMVQKTHNVFEYEKQATKSPRLDESDDNLERLITAPALLIKDESSMEKIPSFLYRKNADDVIDKFLENPATGGMFADIPNIRDVLKEQIEDKREAKILDADNFDRLKNKLNSLASRGKMATLERIPFLLDDDILDNLFDRAALRRLRRDWDAERYKKFTK